MATSKTKNSLNGKFKRNANIPEDLLRVVWTDSWCPYYGWSDLIDIDSDEYYVVTVGILVDETNDVIIVTSSQGMTDPNKVINPLVIPKVAIKYREKL